MSNVKKGNLTASNQWWQHLRWLKRDFWKGERQAHKREIRAQVDDGFEGLTVTNGGALTMSQMYGDGSSHEACQDCGRCKVCGDCECGGAT